MLAKWKGFTLIELLIVVAIIAILAAIAVPNFLEAQTRSRVARVKADMRTLATGLESYMVDNNMYPPCPAGGWNYYKGLQWVTTPIAYVTNVLRDPFNMGFKDGNPGGGADPNEVINFEYGAGNLENDPFHTGTRNHMRIAESAKCWLLVSYGPDINDHTASASHFPFTLYATPYDPTNGTKSAGDIYRRNPPYNENFISELNPYKEGDEFEQGLYPLPEGY